MDINTYLKEKLEERNLSIEDLIIQSGASKSTIYRVITGAQKPSKSLVNKMINILHLNYVQQQELKYYFSNYNVDHHTLEAREAVYDLLFTPKNSQPKKIELVYYDQEKYIRTFDDILNIIFEFSKNHNFTCQFKLINCLLEDIISPLSAFITTLTANERSFTFEHLINFSTFDYRDNINTLSTIIPLITLENYSLKYREEKNIADYGFFHDFLIVDLSYDDEKGSAKKTSLYLTFLSDDLSSCYVINMNQNNTRDFFQRNYDSLERKCKPALNSRKTLVEYITMVIELFRKNDSVLFMSHPPFARVPFAVYESILSRIPIEDSVEDFVELFVQDKYNEKNIETRLEELLNQVKLVEESTYVNKQLDIYTKPGIENFVSTGLMVDHLEFLPPFNKKEVRMILESIKARDKNPKDPFNFLIINEPYGNENLSFSAENNHCLLVEKYIDSNTPFCLIEHENLSAIFTDFGTNYVSTMMAISKNEAYKFIDFLMETYC